MESVNYKNKVWSWMFPYGNPANLSRHILFLIAEEFVHDVLKLPKTIKEETGYKHIFRNESKFKEWYKEKYPNYQKHLNY